jgi:hypothetical protein
MIAMATGLFTVYRGETTNGFGDTVDLDVAQATGVPMAIMPATQASTRHANDRQQRVLYYRGRCASTVDVQLGDRLANEANTTVVYLVTNIHQALNPIMSQDTALDLERVPTT